MSKKYPKICETCGSDFRGACNQKFCSSQCMKIAYQMRKKNKGQPTKLINEITYPFLFRKADDNLVKDAKKANELGLTYGTFIAYRKLGILEVAK